MAIDERDGLFLFLFFLLRRIQIGEVFPEYFLFNFVPLCFLFLESRVKPEHVKLEFFHEFVVKRDVVGDLVLLFNQVQLRSHAGIVFEVLLSDLEQFFDGVLDTAFDLTVMQNGAKSLEDGVDTSRRCFGQYLSTVDKKLRSQLNRVLGRLL